ncbi:MAG TPA: hypothetical protein VIS06_02645 [Mycobacteriales bacterium]
MSLYATVQDLRDRLSIGPADTSRDSILTRVLTAASRAIDKRTNRVFSLDATATARVYNPRGRIATTPDGQVVLVDDIGDAADLLVEVGSGSAWTPVTDYESAPDNALVRGQAITGLLRPCLPWVFYPQQRIRVTARWGWPTVPDEIAEAALIQAARLFKRKDSPEGVMGNSEWGVIRLSRIDPDVEALVGPYIRHGFA